MINILLVSLSDVKKKKSLLTTSGRMSLYLLEMNEKMVKLRRTFITISTHYAMYENITFLNRPSFIVTLFEIYRFLKSCVVLEK